MEAHFSSKFEQITRFLFRTANRHLLCAPLFAIIWGESEDDLHANEKKEEPVKQQPAPKPAPKEQTKKTETPAASQANPKQSKSNELKKYDGTEIFKVK